MSSKTAIASQGKALSGICKRPKEETIVDAAKTLIIMIHGFPGHKAAHSDLYGDLQSILTEQGRHTLRFDFRGCGQSQGEEGSFTLKAGVEDLNSIINWAKTQGYKEFIFISEGFGTTIAMLARVLQLKAHIMLWPAINPKALGDMHEQSGRYPKGFIKSLQAVKIGPHIREIVKPTLILHGTADNISPVQQLDLVRKHAGAKHIEIMTFHNGKHGLPEMSERKALFSQIEQFLNKHA